MILLVLLASILILVVTVFQYDEQTLWLEKKSKTKNVPQSLARSFLKPRSVCLRGVFRELELFACKISVRQAQHELTALAASAGRRRGESALLLELH